MPSLLQKLALATYRSPPVHLFLRTSPGSRVFILCYDLYKNMIEVPENHMLARTIPPDSWVIDVGANVGFFTERFARWVSGSGRVIAIEPDAENLALLRRRMGKQAPSVVDVHEAVATEYNGVARLLKNPDHPGDHRIGDSGEQVAAVTIDVLIERAGNPDVALIKIDTQGSEKLVLAGSSNVLRRCKPNIFIEIDDSALREYGSSAADLIKDLHASGYALFRLSRFGGKTPMPPEAAINLATSARRGYVDLLCVHPDRENIE